MAIANGQVLLLQALKKSGAWAKVKSICELGSQVPIADELAMLFKTFDKAPLVGDFGAKELYDYLGVSDYSSIDFNGLYGAHPFDLNRDLVTDYDYKETFDLVTNYGTANVVFNQNAFFRNVHNLCKTNGYMIHTFPSKGWGNQWFYRHDVRLIEDLAAANDYQILFLEPFLRFKPYLGNPNSDGLQQIRSLCDFIESTTLKVKQLQAAGTAVNPDQYAQQEIEKSPDVKRALDRVGKEDALFNITLACVLKKGSDKAFQAPVLNIYQNTQV